MTGLKIQDRSVVVPGEILAEGLEYLPSYGTYREGDKVYASKLGLANVDGKVIKLIPLSGGYSPKKGDNVIAKVTEILMSGWRFDMNCAYQAMLGMKDATSDFIPKGADLRVYFDIDDYVLATVVNVTSQKLIDLSMKGPGLRKLKGGRILKVNPYKVPRIIGKQGSMVSMIKNATGCRVTVGQNGVVWVQGEPEAEILAIETIRKIEAESHIPGLTDKIKKFLEEKTGKSVDSNTNNAPQGESNEEGN